MSRQTKSENQIIYICDFRRYEKSSSKKRPTWKGIDFDSVVQNTKSSKSIILMSAFSNILLQSRSSEATNIGYRFSSRAVFGWILFELNSSCGDLGERVEVFCLLSEYCRLNHPLCSQPFSSKQKTSASVLKSPPPCLIHLLQPQHRSHCPQ